MCLVLSLQKRLWIVDLCHKEFIFLEKVISHPRADYYACKRVKEAYRERGTWAYHWQQKYFDQATDIGSFKSDQDKQMHNIMQKPEIL